MVVKHFLFVLLEGMRWGPPGAPYVIFFTSIVMRNVLKWVPIQYYVRISGRRD